MKRNVNLDGSEQMAWKELKRGLMKSGLLNAPDPWAPRTMQELSLEASHVVPWTPPAPPIVETDKRAEHEPKTPLTPLAFPPKVFSEHSALALSSVLRPQELAKPEFFHLFVNPTEAVEYITVAGLYISSHVQFRQIPAVALVGPTRYPVNFRSIAPGIDVVLELHCLDSVCFIVLPRAPTITVNAVIWARTLR